MEINITSKNGATLHTANKYCSEDINVIPQTQQLNITPSNATQSFAGLYDTVSVDAIKLQ